MINRANSLIGAILCTFVVILFSLLTALNIIEVHKGDEQPPKEILQKMKQKNPDKIVIGHLNINSIRYKLEFLMEIISTNIDLFLISETKLDASFPTSQFIIDGYHTPFREDRDNKGDKGGGLLLYVRDHIPCRRLVIDFIPKIEAIVIEINFRKKKWILIGLYNPQKDMLRSHLDSISRKLNELCLKYENFILIGDFNSEMTEESMQIFCDTYNLKSLVKEPTCFKNVEKPSCIDLILTNKIKSFQNTCVLETGLSDFHKLISTTMKSTFRKQAPQLIHYRNYKRFNNDDFQSILVHQLNALDIRSLTCSDFQSLFMTILNHLAPQKVRYIRANNSPFMNKSLCKAIMVRSRLRNRFLKEKTLEAREAYKIQRNYCVSLLRHSKKFYYENLNPNSIRDNKKFWKQVKPLFADKTPVNTSVTLLEDGSILTDPYKCAEVLNTFFSEAVNNLGIDRKLHVEPVVNAFSPVDRAIKMYKNHPSIISIIELRYPKNCFSFKPVTGVNVETIICKIDPTKAYQRNDIPPKVLKENVAACTEFLSTDINKCINSGKFPNCLKNSDISPIFKKIDPLSKTNYRPVSILPTLSKVYERVIHEQIYEYFNGIFSKYLCGFRKGHSTQHCLLFMLEKLKRALDKGFITGILLTDLSKAFDSISHELLIAKLHAYGFSTSALNLIYDYLSERMQRTKIGNVFSTWRSILYGFPQGSILGPLLFNIDINDLFYSSTHIEIANFADDNTPFEFSGSVNDVIKKLEKDAIYLMGWFENNYLVPNPEKWHLLLSETDSNLSISIGNKCIHNSNEEKILGVTFDNKLTFNNHISKLCKKASQKIHALARVSDFMSPKQRLCIMNAFITSHFCYCPLLWMCHSRTINNRINKIHERSLRIVYRDEISSYEQLLVKSESVTIHHKNIQVLATEIYKAINNLSSSLMSELFDKTESRYNLRKEKKIATCSIRTTKYGLNSISYLGPKIWDLVPNEIKRCDNLISFKQKIKSWRPENCPCTLCKVYIPNLGYL